MWPRSLSALLAPVALLALAGCPGGNAGLGEPCSGHDTCDSRYQCVSGVCAPRCQRGPECGDGYVCTTSGLCVLATGQAGDSCESETDCAPGLACGIDGTLPDGETVVSTCTPHNQARPAGAPCELNSECSNKTCALGMCVDLCRETRDCISGTGCTAIPLVDNSVSPATVGGNFNGCLPSRGSIVWSIPVSSPKAQIAVPVPEAAQSATIVFQVSDLAQRVGAASVLEPDNDEPVYMKPCDPLGPTDPTCNPVLARNQYFSNRLRHLPASGQSVLQIPTRWEDPSTSERPVFQWGAYRITAQSFRPNGQPGSAIPHVTAILKMDTSVNLDLHFHFLNLDDHPCDAAYGGVDLNAELARTGVFFQGDDDEDGFLDDLRQILAEGGIALTENTTYTDIRNRPELDGLAREDAGTLLSLGTHSTGLDVFFVRSLTPVGLLALGPNPGPAGLPGTRESGIVVSIDALCFAPTPEVAWRKLARLTAHQIARYMGLYNTIELENLVEREKGIPVELRQYEAWADQIEDTNEAPNNLMFFSENGGTFLTRGQREILKRNAVLR